MGLDMYLEREYDCGGAKGIIDISVNNVKIPIKLDRCTYITEQIGYWRKAYAIHNWFVKNIQDGVDNCGSYEVLVEDLRQLLEICTEIDAKAQIDEKPGYTWGVILNTWDMEKLLPMEEMRRDKNGVLYDFGYLYNARRTKDILTELLNEDRAIKNQCLFPEYIYRSSW